MNELLLWTSVGGEEQHAKIQKGTKPRCWFFGWVDMLWLRELTKVNLFTVAEAAWATWRQESAAVFTTFWSHQFNIIMYICKLCGKLLHNHSMANHVPECTGWDGLGFVAVDYQLARQLHSTHKYLVLVSLFVQLFLLGGFAHGVQVLTGTLPRIATIMPGQMVINMIAGFVLASGTMATILLIGVFALLPTVGNIGPSIFEMTSIWRAVLFSTTATAVLMTSFYIFLWATSTWYLVVQE